ncbi:hypothetical protein TURU_123310 [Turdus rufiventris]|nr:hypothetical protein TURU_123310 [Turdus rufiventris]
MLLKATYLWKFMQTKDFILNLHLAKTRIFVFAGATKDMGKMLGGDEEKDPDAAKKEEERQEALRQQEEERKAKYAKMEAEREVMRQGIRDKFLPLYSKNMSWKRHKQNYICMGPTYDSVLIILDGSMNKASVLEAPELDTAPYVPGKQWKLFSSCTHEMCNFLVFHGSSGTYSGIKGTLSKFGTNTKLCGAVNTLERRDVIQRDLDRLERSIILHIVEDMNMWLKANQYGIKKKEEKEAEAQAALEANAEGSLTRPKKAIPPGCGDEEEEEEESILDTVIKYLPGPLQDMFKK